MKTQYTKVNYAGLERRVLQYALQSPGRRPLHESGRNTTSYRAAWHELGPDCVYEAQVRAVLVEQQLLVTRHITNNSDT